MRSQYVVGADGARSRVLGQAGLTVEGPDDLARAANIWFRADLSRYLAHRPGVLTWNVMPGPLPPLRLGTLICHKPFTEFVLAFMYDPAQVSLDAMSTGELHGTDKRLRRRGRRRRDPRCRRMAGARADRARLCGGRVFCMGDAVHRHPPTNGLGSTCPSRTRTTSAGSWLSSWPGRRAPRSWTATRRNDSRSARRASSAPSPACRKEPRSRPPSATSRASPPRPAGKRSTPCTSPARRDERRDALHKRSS